MLFVLKLPRVTVDDIMVLYTSDLAFGWLLTRWLPSSWLRCQSFSGEIHGSHRSFQDRHLRRFHHRGMITYVLLRGPGRPLWGGGLPAEGTPLNGNIGDEPQLDGPATHLCRSRHSRKSAGHSRGTDRHAVESQILSGRQGQIVS